MPILIVPIRGIMFSPFTTTLHSLIVVNVVFVIKVIAWKPLLICFQSLDFKQKKGQNPNNDQKVWDFSSLFFPLSPLGS